MRIGILGGDGFVGWPTTLHLSARGHEVVIVDSLVRRAIDGELDVQSPTPITSPKERRDAWEQSTDRSIGLERSDLAQDYDALRDWLARFRPTRLSTSPSSVPRPTR